MNPIYSLFRKSYVLVLIGLSLTFSSQVWSANYSEAIKEGQTAAQELIQNKEASALTIALVDANHIIWSQTFGSIDPKTGKLPTLNTMFGVGSVSKVLATIAIMKLVDQGKINLDSPLTDYIPSFKMASPEYKNITVRMLLNHSAGFPGTDYRNALIRSRIPDYSNQVLQTLSHSRLKASPGYMNVYCNDCFTLVEALIKEKTGKDYVQFMQDEIFKPLNMKNSRYPTTTFSNGSYVKSVKDGKVLPQEFVNTLASGGAYTTANDMARIAMMFLNNGTLGSTRILSKESIAKMAEDQTVSKFEPIRGNNWAYGLGWDTVTQPGLSAVGYDGWAKGGDSDDYGAVLIVSPKAGLGIVVIGASGFSSGKATAVAERILLRALAENGKIPSFPLPLNNPPLKEQPKQTNIKESNSDIAGIYASGMFIFNLEVNPDNGLKLSTLSDEGWKQYGELLYPTEDGWYADPKKPFAVKVITSNLYGKPAEYLVIRAPQGYGHYKDNLILGQKMHSMPQKLSAIWQARLPLIWLAVNQHPDELNWSTMDPRLRLFAIPGLQGLIAIRTPSDPRQLQILDPSTNDVATMMLTIPQLNGRDLNDLVIVKRDNEEWIRFGSYMHQPLSSIKKLEYGKKETITIGSEGYAEWRTISSQKNPIRIDIKTAGSWKLYDADFKSLGNGKGDGAVNLPAGNGDGYLILFGKPGETITVDTHSNQQVSSKAKQKKFSSIIKLKK